MHSAFLPDWLRLTWAVLLFGVVAAHAAHISLMSGQRQWWHVGHTAMAAAMMLMYLVPPMSSPVPYRVGLVLFALSTVGIAAIVVALRRREGALNPLWITSCLDMLVMTYMLLPMRAQPAALSYVLAIYLAGTALAWTAGLWKRVPVFRQPLPAAAGSPAAAPSRASGSGTLGLTAECTADVPVTLAVMATSMAYMLLVM